MATNYQHTGLRTRIHQSNEQSNLFVIECQQNVERNHGRSLQMTPIRGHLHEGLVPPVPPV